MRAMKSRSAEEGVRHHEALHVRVYESEWPHDDRIRRTRALLQELIAGRTGVRIVELGCGAADISGPYSEANTVIGIDCNPKALEVAEGLYPYLNTVTADVSTQEVIACDIVIMCEFLEHIENPQELVARWLPQSELCIISHPLNEALECGLSAGEHQWSYAMSDYDNWFAIGGHESQTREVFKMGCYDIIVGWGRRK